MIFQECHLFVKQTCFFPGGSIIMFFEQTQIFQESLSNKHVFLRRVYLFVKQILLSHRTDTNFPRNPYLVLEHIRIFQELLFSHRTVIHFPGDPFMPQTDRHFPGSYLRRTDISLIGLSGCFRYYYFYTYQDSVFATHHIINTELHGFWANSH